MEENEINPRLTNGELYDSAEYNNNLENTEFITFKKGENSFIKDKYIGNPSNEISPIKFTNPIYTRPFNSIDNLNKNRFTYNYHNRNQYSNNSMPVNVIRNDNYINRKTNVNKSQDFSPYFYNNKTSNYKNYHNRSLLYNGNTTDEGDSYINPNRDSNYYNNPNKNKSMYLGVPMDYPLEEKIDNNNNISDYSNEEQLIIYPEKKYIFINESYFNKKSNEGILKPKNLETYEVKSIEYIPDEEHKYKSISLGDYILKKGNKNRMRKNKSCTNININNLKNESEKEYDIKVLSNKKKERGKKVITSDIINNIKLIKDKYDTKKQINNINVLKSKENNTDDNFSFDELNKNINKGGIVDLSDKKKYNTSFIRERKYNINNNEYPDWKILASACLIQSWFRSLKRLKNPYKKNLQKIVIIQKVYKMHYKNKILSSKRKPNIYKNYRKEPSEDYNNKLYKNKDNIKYLNNYNKQSLPKYKKTIPIIYNPNTDESNPNYRNNNSNIIYNRPSISKINNNFSYKDKTINKGTYFVPKSFRYYDTQYNIALLLIEKIIENKILKMYFDFLFNLKKYIKKDIKSDDNTSKPGIKIKLEPTKIKRNKNKINTENNKKEEESNNQNNIIINDKDKYNFNSKQKFLLKKLFIRIWLRQALKLKNAKRTHWKDRFKNKEKKHILLNNINKFVMEKIKQEVKRRKIIVSFNIINSKKYTNLKYALKKIKKYAKVRYNVLNNYASIIQNAFRFYLENKYKEGK